jgi:hypothetical protein
MWLRINATAMSMICAGLPTLLLGCRTVATMRMTGFRRAYEQRRDH